MYEKGDGKIDVEHPYFWGVECVFDTKEGIKMRNDLNYILREIEDVTSSEIFCVYIKLVSRNLMFE